MLRPLLVILGLVLLGTGTAHAQQQEETPGGAGETALEQKIRLLLDLAGDGGEGEQLPSAEEVQAARLLLEEIRKEVELEQNWFLFGGLDYALGYARNVLREDQGELNAAYVKGGAEASAAFFRDGEPLYSLYVMGEHREFLDGKELDSEDLALIFSNLRLGKDPRKLIKSEVTAFFARQIMEDPLLEGTPSLLTVWNARARTGVELAFDRHRLFVGHLYIIEEYDEEALDSKSGGLFASWSWDLTETLELKTDLEYAPQAFEDRLARYANGFPIRGSPLYLERLTLASHLIWKPSLPWIERNAFILKARRDWSDASIHDRNWDFRVSNDLEFAWKQLVFGPSLAADYRDYDNRLVFPPLPDTQWRWHYTASAFIQYSMADHTDIELRYRLEYADSNRNSLDYETDDLQIRLRHSF